MKTKKMTNKSYKIIWMFLVAFSMMILSFGGAKKASAAANTWVNVGSAGFSAGNVDFTDIAFNPSTYEPYVVYRDSGNAYKATVMKFNGTTWVNVGTAGFSAGQAINTSIAFNPSTNEPYVVYRDFYNANKATVMKFNGSSWVNVGSAGFSADYADDTSIAFNPSSNEPYVVYRDGNNLKATVMKFDGSSWINVGAAGFSSVDYADGVAYTDIAFNPSTYEPYVVYAKDSYNSNYKATVMKFDGSSWINVGSADFSAGMASYTRIAFNPSTNEPYVVYEEGWNSNATVMKFDGSSWINVGSADFSAGTADYTSIAFNPSSNEPYVTYSDASNSYEATVMRFNGTSWVNVGSAGFSAGGRTYYTSIAFNSSTNEPYVTYRDDGSNSKANVMKFNSNQAATPTASPAGGTYSSTQTVALATTTSGADIYYTTNGSTPTTGSIHYTGVLSVSSGLTLKAIAVKSGMADSDVMSEVYTLPTPVYRFWSNAKQGHFYTASESEKDSIIANDHSWTYEGVAYNSFTSQESNTSPIYRFWSNSKQHHFFTASAAEKDSIIANDPSWAYEGIAYYAYATEQSNTTAVYRFWSNSKQGHFFTISAAEKDSIIANDHSWNYEGIAWYVPTS